MLRPDKKPEDSDTSTIKMDWVLELDDYGDEFEIEQCRSLGLHLVKDLAAQLDGRLVIARDGGTQMSVILPIKPSGANS